MQNEMQPSIGKTIKTPRNKSKQETTQNLSNALGRLITSKAFNTCSGAMVRLSSLLQTSFDSDETRFINSTKVRDQPTKIILSNTNEASSQTI